MFIPGCLRSWGNWIFVMQARVHLLLILLTVFVIGMAALFWVQANEVFAPEPVAKADSSRVISIARADWGLNCQGKPNRKASGPVAQGMAPPPKVYEIPDNNAYAKVAALCDGQLACSFDADEDTLGPDPAPGCPKTLAVEYRCFSYDAAWRIEGKPGSSMSINCRSASPAP